MPELVDVGLLAVEHRLQGAERPRIEIEGHAREEVMDEVEVLEHVKPVGDRLQHFSLEPEHIGVAIALMHLMRFVRKMSVATRAERGAGNRMRDSRHPALTPIAEQAKEMCSGGVGRG